LGPGLSLHLRFRLRCCPSSLYTFPPGLRPSRLRSGLPSARPVKVFPNLSSSTPKISPGALNVVAKSLVSTEFHHVRI
jgi:hypothetical protein